MDTISRRQMLGAMAARGAAGWVLLQNQARPRMIERAIPRGNERLPVIGLGTWQTFDVSGAAALEPLGQVLQKFADLGGRVIDSSPMYGRSETVVGALGARLGLHDRLFFATKVWTRGREDGIRQMETSMRQMQVRRLDLMQVHNLLDVDTHLRTLADWKEQGRIRYIGITHYQVSAFDALERYLSRDDIDFVQFNYSLAVRDAERRLLPFAAERKVAVLINRPFESGAMFTRVRGKPLPAWAAEIDCTTWGQVFLKYIVSNPAVTAAIPATSNPRHLEDNLLGGVGRLPDSELRLRMAREWEQL
jgi:diketogulonate reductase-like aldo/keto reductase